MMKWLLVAACVASVAGDTLFFLPHNSTPTPSIDCPGGVKCKDEDTCCKMTSGTYGCCPFPKAVCCADNLHCCPTTTICDTAHHKCIKGPTSVPMARKTPAIPTSKLTFVSKLAYPAPPQAVICPGGRQECPSHTTCCQTATGYGCCPFPMAVCCSDEVHCCPHNMSCDVASGSCIRSASTPAKELTLPLYLHTKQRTKVVATKFAPNFSLNVKVVCPDKRHDCPSGSTCCQQAAGGYGCCYHPNATCCSDKLHCCPSGMTCDLAYGRCVSEVTKPSDVRVRYNTCPGGETVCPDKQTCCEIKGGGYGCCPFPKAVCCTDGEHCCPSDYTCDVEHGACLHGDLQINWMVKVDPRSKGTCCSDGIHCCPVGSECSPRGNSCVRSVITTPLLPIGMLTTIQNIHDPKPKLQTPWDTPESIKNQRKNDDEWKVPTTDNERNIPIHDDGVSHGNGKVPTTDNERKIPIHDDGVSHGNGSVSNRICPGGRLQCYDFQTCCKRRDDYGCCPFPNAVCCADREHCCKSGYTCTNYGCEKNGQPTTDTTVLVAPAKDDTKAVRCPGGRSECRDGSTCCLNFYGRWGCCRFPYATCCSDRAHCCPYGYRCQYPGPSCIGMTYNNTVMAAAKNVPSHPVMAATEKALSHPVAKLMTEAVATVPGRLSKESAVSSVECEVCQYAMAKLESMLSDKTTQEEVKLALEHVCSFLPVSMATECKQLVDQYTNEIIRLITSGLSPKLVCTELGLCTSHKQAPVSSAVECEVCQFVMAKLESMLSDKSTQEEVKLALERVCSFLPVSMATECKQLVDQYTNEIIRLITSGLSPKLVCTELGLCTSHKQAPVSSTVECEVCQFVMAKLESMLSDKSTQEEVKLALERVCSFLPVSMATECKQLVDQYTNEIIRLITSGLSPKLVCTELGLCTSHKQAPVSSTVECEVCQFVMAKLESMLSDKSTQEEVKLALERVCSFLPVSMATECKQLVDQYTNEIIRLITSGLSPKLVCTELGLCTSQQHPSNVTAVVCPGGHVQCPNGHTCCVTVYGAWSCCPYPVATCCQDHQHCCPYGHYCLFPGPRCVSITTNKTMMAADKVPSHPVMAPAEKAPSHPVAKVMTKAVAKVATPDGESVSSAVECEVCQFVMAKLESMLSDKSTQEEVKLALERVCSFLPVSMATECKQLVDQYTNEIIRLITSGLSPKLVCAELGLCTSQQHLSNVTAVVCPGGHVQCPNGHTCCVNVYGAWTCCPYPVATCCQDHTHCCPYGHYCLFPGPRCVSITTNKTIMAADKVPSHPVMAATEKALSHPVTKVMTKAVAKVATPDDIELKSVMCPGGKYQCPNGYTCCVNVYGAWSCCPYVQATCCQDHTHCCPYGHYCLFPGPRCVSITTNKTIMAADKVPSHPVMAATEKVPTHPVIAATEKVPTHPVNASVCPDKSKCPQTCCPMKNGAYSCCPFENAVCCGDKVHCCPAGDTCPKSSCSSSFVQLIGSHQPIKSTAMEVVVSNVLCPGGRTQCPSGNTCCQLPSGQYGCCPLPRAVCCPDHAHCCPHGYTCASGGFCTKGAQRIRASLKTSALAKVTELSNIVCPDGTSECPDRNTCCRLSSGGYGCCPVPNAVCCPDHAHCCPHGYTCSGGGYCTKGDQRIRASLKTSALAKVAELSNVVCPGGTSECPDRNTCCRLSSGGYGCCPVPNAVCCSDHVHCCPSGYTCSGAGFCTKGDQRIRASLKTPAIVTSPENNVVCPGGTTQCPDGNTCCRLSSGGYGCCPVPNAVCCPDHAHCCPDGYTCASGGYCTKGTQRIRAALKTTAMDVTKVVCPDKKSECPTGQTCCPIGGGGYGCCPIPAAVCCEDKLHCCPSGYKCKKTGCERGGKTIPHLTKTPATIADIPQDIGEDQPNARATGIMCPNKQSECPDGYTCCLLASGQYGCCPLPDATCCADRLHCCPRSYVCSESGCARGDVLLPFHTKIPAKMLALVPVKQGTVEEDKGGENIICPDGASSCPPQSTCCRRYGGYGCCGLPKAVCCSDHTHCCPYGTECDLAHGRCIQGERSFPMVKNTPALAIKP